MAKLTKVEKEDGRIICKKMALEKFEKAFEVLNDIAVDQGSMHKYEILEKMIEIGRLANEAKQLDEMKELII